MEEWSGLVGDHRLKAPRLVKRAYDPERSSPENAGEASGVAMRMYAYLFEAGKFDDEIGASVAQSSLRLDVLFQDRHAFADECVRTLIDELAHAVYAPHEGHRRRASHG